MRKILSVILCVCLVLCCMPLAALAAAIGDVNASNSVTAEDARTILRAAVGYINYQSAKLFNAADVDRDGSIAAADARLALRAAVGLEALD